MLPVDELGLQMEYNQAGRHNDRDLKTAAKAHK